MKRRTGAVGGVFKRCPVCRREVIAAHRGIVAAWAMLPMRRPGR